MKLRREPSGIDVWRRRALRQLGAMTALLGLAPLSRFAHAATPARAVLRGTEFDLEISQSPVTIDGKRLGATTVNGQIPAPLLVWREGDTITLRVTNRLNVYTSIHWHGVLLPAEMDGVPGLSFAGIAPGETFVYTFEVKQYGTYWYHSHSGFQEQTGLYGPIVIEPRQGERVKADREHVIMLSDWTDDDPSHLFAKLKKMSDFFNFNRPTAGDFFADVSKDGLSAALEKRRMWNKMRMVPTDLSDVSAAPGSDASFTYLVNGKSARENWYGAIRAGEKVRLRIINGSATTIFDVRIPGLKMTVISADGQDVEPVAVDEMRISVAETYDVLIEPQNQAYCLFAQSIGRTGFVSATLAPDPGLKANIPPMDPSQWLTMTDMMGAMGAMGSMGGMAGMAGMSGQAAPIQGHDMSTMGAHAGGHTANGTASGTSAQATAPASTHAGMPGMDHAAMGGTQPMTGMDHANMPGMGPGKAPDVRHARSEYGPMVDMHVDMPRTNLDDPGINLRDNGRRVLTYADLRTIGGPVDDREPTRDIELHLTGHMERFIWSFDGQKFSESLPIHFRYGERLRIILVNDTMMNHPIHLHGMWSELESPDGQFLVRKHTINVQPAQRIAYRVTADARGRWAYHCHLLYHMEAGMFREVVVS